MDRNKFIGEYIGKYNKTTVEGGKVKSYKGRATIKISEVGEGAFLQTTIDNGKTTFNTLAFIRDWGNKSILVSQAESGEGLVNTYTDENLLISQVTNKSPTVWTVKNYKLKKIKHH
jgi:hypothetical protein